MIDFYNAFISYKHAKLDTEIAELDKQLDDIYAQWNASKK